MKSADDQCIGIFKNQIKETLVDEIKGTKNVGPRGLKLCELWNMLLCLYACKFSYTQRYAAVT